MLAKPSIALRKVGSCALNIPLFCSKHAQLMVGTGRAMLVALLFLIARDFWYHPSAA